MLNCRLLGTQSVVASDYSVDCNDPQHKFYEYVAIVMIVLFSFGMPLGMVLIVHFVEKRRHENHDTPEWAYIARRVATQLAHDRVPEVKDALIDISLGKTYGPLVNAYRPGVTMICTDLATSFVSFALFLNLVLMLKSGSENVVQASSAGRALI